MEELPLRFDVDETGFGFQFVDALVASHARRLFMLYLSGQVESGTDLFPVELVFGELVANVAKHAPGPLAVRVCWHDGHARLEVADHGPGYELRAQLPEDFDEGHRGLFIVAAYAEDLRVDRRGPISVTSVSLPVKRRSAAA